LAYNLVIFGLDLLPNKGVIVFHKLTDSGFVDKIWCVL
jgi:hypothetical protein